MQVTFGGSTVYMPVSINATLRDGDTPGTSTVDIVLTLGDGQTWSGSFTFPSSFSSGPAPSIGTMSGRGRAPAQPPAAPAGGAQPSGHPQPSAAPGQPRR